MDFAGIQLQFGQPIYMYPENTTINNSVVEIKFENYDQLEISNDIKVSVMTMSNTTNATQNGRLLFMFNMNTMLKETISFPPLVTDYEIVQSSNTVVISKGAQSAELDLNIIDDTIVEGVEEITLVLTDGEVVGIEQTAVNTVGIETIVFIQDNDGMYIAFKSINVLEATH